MFPAFASHAWEAFGYAPLLVTGPAVEAVGRRIEIQAGQRKTESRRQSNRNIA